MIWIYGVALLINLAAGIGLARSGWGLAGIASGTLISYLFCSIALLYFSYRQLGESRTAVSYKIAGLLFPAFLAISIIEIIPAYLAKDFSAGAILAVRGAGIIAYSIFILEKIKAHIGLDQIAAWIKKSPDAENDESNMEVAP